jgi:REP element-mobilizing transposase RayT
MPAPLILERKYDYRRKLPHYQKSGRALFVTFCKLSRDPFCGAARDLVLEHCLHDHGRRCWVHAAVVMPEHVHLLLTPLADPKGWPYGLAAILKLIKGVSARSVNRLLGRLARSGKRNRSIRYCGQTRVLKKNLGTSSRTQCGGG